MINSEVLILIFSLGILFRSLTYVNSFTDFKKIFFSLLTGVLVLVFLIFRFSMEYNFGLYSLIVVGIYVVSYSFLQIHKILPDISEQTVLQLSLLTLYIYDTSFYRPDILGNTILLILITFTLLSIFLGFVNYILPNGLKLIFYVIFLLLSTAIGLSYFSFNILNIFLKPGFANQFGYYEAFFSGIAFMYLLANVAYILWLIPLPGKNQTMRDRIREWKEFVKILIGKHTNAQLHPMQTGLNIIIIGGILIINYFFHIFDNFTLILAFITLFQLSDSIFIKHARVKELQSADTLLSK